MVHCVTFKKIPNTDRACAIQIKCLNDVILCINMYMPVDNQGSYMWIQISVIQLMQYICL